MVKGRRLGRGRSGTVGVSEAPAGGDTGGAPGEVLGGRGQADRGHPLGQARRTGQFDQGDVVTDGQHVEPGVLEDLQQAAPLPVPAPLPTAPGAAQAPRGTPGTEGELRDR